MSATDWAAVKNGDAVSVDGRLLPPIPTPRGERRQPRAPPPQTEPPALGGLARAQTPGQGGKRRNKLAEVSRIGPIWSGFAPDSGR